MKLRLTKIAAPGYVKQAYIIITILLSGIVSHAQMRQIYVDPFVADNHIKSISFATPSTGYAGFLQFIGYTTDSGRTFDKRYLSNVDYNGYLNINLTFGFLINGVKAVSIDTLLVYGSYGGCPSILLSTNRGLSYTLIYHTPYNPNYYFDAVTDMQFSPDGNVGYAVTSDRIIKSSNRGRSWTPVVSTPNAEWEGITVPDANTAYAYNPEWNGYKFFKTSNGGASWSQVALPNNDGGVRSTFFLTANKGWIVFADTDSWKIYYTSNGGASWVRKDLGGYAPEKMIFLNDSVGYGIGGLNDTYKTTDSGKIWERLPRDNDYIYLGWGHEDIHFYNSNQFWCGGGHGFLELTTNGGGLPFPKAHFKIDTNGVSNTGITNLVNQSKTAHQFRWYKDDTLIANTYHASYTHHIGEQIDTIMLVAMNATGNDTTVLYQYYNLPPPPPLPTITSFTPTAGFPGTIVTINGTNLNGATAVRFGGVPASSYNVISPTRINAVVGAGNTGDVSVTTAWGTATLPGFTFLTQMKITSFLPASGNIGSSVVINGINFSPVAANNIVYFGGAKAVVTSASATQLVATVPPGATYDPISVTANGNTAYSNTPFVVRFDNGGPITTDIYPDRHKVFADLQNARGEAADIDGDGKLDLVTASSYERRISILRNTGTGDAITFAAPVYITFATGLHNTSLFSIADINGDGKLDLVTNYVSTGISVCINNSTPGNISFTAHNIAPSGISGVSDLVTADFDGDGKTDVFINGTAGTRVLRNTGTTSTVSFNMLPLMSIQGSNASRMRASDVDGDGNTDVCANMLRSGVRTLVVFRNTSNGSAIAFAASYFTTSSASEDDLYVGDIDMDGKPDVAMVDQAASVLSVLRNTSVSGTPSFAPRVTFNTPNQVQGLRMADLNGDGKPDVGLAITTPVPTPAVDTEISVFENTSVPGTISLGQRLDIFIDNNPNGATDITFGDWNNDQRPDAAALARDSTNIFPNRSGTFITQICDGADSSITANLTGAVYQWQEDNGSGFVNISDNANFTGTNTQKLYVNDIPASWNGRRYRCLVDGNTSYLYKLVVKAFVLPQVSIHGPAVICQPEPHAFTARAVNGGLDPVFRWQLNGINIVSGVNVTNGNDDSLLVIQPRNGDILSVVMTSNAACVSSQTVTISDTLKVEPFTFPSAILSASHTKVCNGEPVTFTVTTHNMGDKPTFQWLDNGVPIFMNDTNVFVSSNPNAFIVAIVRSSSLCHRSPISITTPPIALNPNNSGAPTVNITPVHLRHCPGDTVAFVAAHTNGGNNPHFQWQVNGVNVGTNSNVYKTNSPNTNDQVRVIMTSSSACAPTSSVTSANSFTAITPPLVPTITISTPNNICQGGTIAFSAVTTNAGTYPSIQWQVNGVNVGTNSLSYSTTSLNIGDQVRAVLFSSEMCANPGIVYSNVLTMSAGNTTPSITISTPSTTVCAGAGVTFTAAVTNAGNNPVYQWKKNGVNVGTNTDTYSDNALVNGDVITAEFTSTSGCSSTPATVNSNAISMNVTGSVTPSVSITSTATAICTGESITFTATPVNGGTPSYQWQVNGVNAGTSSNTFSPTSLANGAQVRVIMTSNAACAQPLTATSNSIAVTVTNAVNPAVSITSTASTICSGASVTFTAAVTNAGTNPVYQWKKNGVNVGTNVNTYSDNALANNDVITVAFTSGVSCNPNPVTVNSNAITMIVNAALTPSVNITSSAASICVGQSVTFTATPVNGGTTPAYQWQVNGVNTGTNSNTFTSSNLANNAVVKVIMTSNAACLTATTATSNDVTLTVNAIVTPGIVISGNTTVVIGNSTLLASTVTNGGSNPVLQWQDSTSTHNWQNISGATGSTLSYAPAAIGDKVRAMLTSNAGCISQATVTSEPLTFNVLPDGRIPNGPFGVLYYPNPTTSVLTLDSLRLEDKWETVEIMTLSGDHKMSVRNVQNQTKITLYVGGLPAGTYIAVLRRSNGKPGYYRFIKR